MKERGIKIGLIFLLVIMLVGFVCAGQGGVSVPITRINLNEEGINYNLKPERLIFEFNEKDYAIQIRRIKQEYTTFLIMSLDSNKLEDITAHTLDGSFNLSQGERKEIDLDKDGINDILIKSNSIKTRGGYNSIKTADFSVKKINSEKNNEKDIEITALNFDITGNLIQESVSEPVYSQESFFDKVINWVRGFF